MSYTIKPGGQIVRDADGAWIPAHPGNMDYQEFLVWSQKNTPKVEREPEPTYDVKRRAEYPPLHEQLEALFDARRGDTTKLQEIDARIIAVREKYPKPPDIRPGLTGQR